MEIPLLFQAVDQLIIDQVLESTASAVNIRGIIVRLKNHHIDSLTLNVILD